MATSPSSSIRGNQPPPSSFRMPTSGSSPMLSSYQQQLPPIPPAHAHSQSLSFPSQQQQQQQPLSPPSSSQQQQQPYTSTTNRNTLRPMSAYQPLEHPDQARPSSASSSSFHHQQQHLRDSDQQSFRSISAQVRPPAPAIKFKSQDLRDALALHDAHTRKVYMEGYLSRRDELTPQGKPLHPSDERSRWSLCFLQLCGTVLSVWSVAEMTKAAAEGREVPPSYIDITDAFVDYLGVLVEDVPMPPPQPIRRVQHDNVFTLNSAGQNRIHFCVEGAVGRRLVQAWINAIRLASWEKMRLEEVYTGALLRTRLSAIAAQQAAAQGLAPPGPDGIILGPDGTPLPPLKLVTPLVKGKMEGYIKARFMGTTEWQSCYLVLQERRAAHEDESMLANAVAGASNASSSTPGQASIDASFGSPNASSSGGGEKKRFWQKLPGTGSNRDSILSFGGGGGGGSNEPGSPSGPGGFGTGFAFTNDPSMADPAALEPPPGHNGAAGLAMFYENKKSKKPFATMMHVSAVFAVYPSRPELVEGSSLFKVEGAFPGSNILSATHHARQTGFVLILPEVDSSGSTPSSPPLGAAGSAALGANTKMMNWAIGFMDVFRLYGRPRALSWDPRDPASFFFAYPIGNFRDRLFLDRELAEFLDIREERHAAQRTNLSMVIRKRMQGERTPVLPPLPVPNRESTALLERRASRLVSGGVSKVGAPPNVGPTPPVTAGQNGSTPANGNGASAPPPVAKPPRPDSDEEDTEDEPEDDDDDDEEPLSRKQSAPLPPRLTVTNGPADSPPAIAPTRVVASDTAVSSSSTPRVTPREATAIPSEYTPSRLGQTNVTAGGATTTAAQAAQSSALTPAETQQNIAQLRRLSEVDPGLGPEFAALLNFDGGFDDFGGGNPTTGGAAATAAAVGLGAAAPLAEKKAAIHGHGAANAAANAYGAPPGVPPTAPLNVKTSTSSTAWSSSAASAQPEGGLPPLVPPKTESSAASGAYGPSPASTTRQSPYTSTSPSSYSGTSGGVGASAGSLGSTVVRPTAVLATPAPIPEASPALPIVPEDRPLETKSKSMVPDAEAAVPKAQQQGQRGSTGAYDESALFFMSSMSDQLPAGQPAAVTPSAQVQPTSPQAVSSAREDKLQQLSPTPADRPNNSGQEDASIGDDALAAYSYLEKPPSPALQNGGAFANAAADMSRDSSTSAASHPPRPLPPTTTFSQANKRAMERKTAAQLQAQAHQEALKTPGGAGGATAGGSGSKKKKVVDMGRARKRGTGAWVGDTSSDDDEDEEEEEDDDDDEKGNNEPILSRSQAQLRQGQQQVSTPPTVPGSAGGIPPRARVGSGPQAANMGNMEELQRAAAQAGLQAPAPGRFSSYEGFAPGAGPSGMRAPSPAAAAGATSGGYRTASPSAVGSAGWQSSGRNSPFGVGATGSGRNSPRMGGSPAAGPVHVVGPGSAAMMLQAATGGRAGTPPAHAGAGGPGGLRNSNNPRMSVFNSHLGAQHDGASVSGGGGGQYTPGLAERDASGEHLATPPTFVQLKEEEQPGAMTALFQPSGLLQAGAQDKAERSAKAREEDARAAGGHLVSVPNKPPPPQAGLLGAITAHERDRKGAGGIGATLTERERERVTVERRQREEEQAAAMGMYQRNSMMMGMGMPMGPPMGMYPNPYMWQQMMMQQQQQQQMMMAAAHQQRAGSPGGWGGSQVGGAGSPPGASSPGRAGTPSGPAGGGHSQMGSGASGYVDPMAAQQAAMQAAHQAYMQAMSQMGGGGAGAGPGSDMNRMSMMSMGMPPPGTMGMGGGYMPAPMSMMGFPPFAGGPGSMMMGHGGGMTPNSEYGAGTAGGPLVGAGFGGGAGAMPSPASMAAAARQRTKSGSPGTGGQAQR